MLDRSNSSDKLLINESTAEVEADVGAQLPRIKLVDGLLISVLSGLIFAADGLFSESPIGPLLLPPLITFWIAFRLRKSRRIGWINPFSVGFVSTFVVGVVYSRAATWFTDWHSFLEFSAENSSWVVRLIAALEFGLLLGFLCIIFATLFVKRPSEEEYDYDADYVDLDDH